MGSRTWNQIESLFLQAVDLPAEERSRFLDSACAGNTALRAEIDSLLARDAGDDQALTHALAAEAAQLLHPPGFEGERMGAYRILRAIGRGGMGAVYLAIRDDDQYRQQVAIKIVKRGMDTADVLRRFRHERQILAGLEHPYIARLLDGGCTADGRPFLVMELVEGRPINDYCHDNNLNIEARCRLFLKVCEAVSYAHRRLVVHRDLKPFNILITPDGFPKLLDFGLAKILDPGCDHESTSSPFAPLTPEYASPEQIRGGPLSTATDIYSLGVILHELLAGRIPHRMEQLASGEWERMVCETEVARPSTLLEPRPDQERWRRNLQGDLDNIVMLALRKEADRRYSSVDGLAADIRNYLESRPVHARPDSLWYRTTKFTRRRRFPLLAAACVLASLVCGMVIAIGQAHSAEAAKRLAVARQQESQRARQTAEAEHSRAEKERDVAIAARQVAEDRMTQMVNLSDRSLSEVYALMERLAGGMPARRELIATTLDFLEKLSKDAGSNSHLRVALAKAYSRLGDIQADPSNARTGGLDGAMKSYRAGSGLLQAGPQQPDTGKDGLLAWLDLQEKIGMLHVQMAQLASAPPLLRHAIAVAEQAAASQAFDKDIARRRGSLYLALSKSLHPELAESRPVAETSVDILSALVRQYPSDPDLRYDLSRAYTERGYLLWNLLGVEAAREDYVKTVELREQLVKEHPTDTLYRRTLVLAYVHFGNVGDKLNQPEVVRSYYKKALAVAEVDAADPQNLVADGDYGFLLLNTAAMDEHAPEAEILATMRKAVTLLEHVVAAANQTNYAHTLSYGYESIGLRLKRSGNYAEAIPNYRRAVSVAETHLGFFPGDQPSLDRVFTTTRELTLALAQSGDRQGALDQAATLIRRVEQSKDRGATPGFVETQLATAHLAVAEVYRAFQQWRPARDAAEEAIRHAQAMPMMSDHDANAKSEMLQNARAVAAECSAKM